MKTRFTQAIKIFGIMAIVAAFAALAFPARSFANSVTDQQGKAVVTVYYQANANSRYQPVANAAVSFSSPDSNLTIDALTDAKGQARVSLPAGDYYVDIVAKGFKPVQTKMTIIGNTSQELKLGLTSDNTRR